MARVLCVVGGLTGLLHSSMELARRLEVAGHDVTVASAATAGDTVRTHGIRFLELDLRGYQQFQSGDAIGGLLSRIRSVDARLERAADAMSSDGLSGAIDDVRPDLILVDVEMHEQIIRVVAAGIPTALLVSFVSIWRRPGLPPPHHLACPGVGWRGTSLGLSLLWANLRVKKWQRFFVERLRWLGCDRVSALRRLAQRVGFDFRREVDFGQWLIPFTCRRVPAFCLHALEFEFPHTPRAGVHYVGPLLPEPHTDPRVSAATHARLDAALERRRKGAARTLIYAGFGSFFSADTALVRRLVAAAADRVDWELVISLGGKTAGVDLGPLPPNACALPWVPQLEVLRRADVAVVHGGAATVDECVVCSVPMLVYCGFETDMGGIAARVRYHGVGIIGDARRDDVPAIGRHVERLVSDPRFQKNLHRLQSSYATYQRDRTLERVVDALLSTGLVGDRPSGEPARA